ncbi:DUF4190 domain-containing protein [Leifsonia poae]|uniref:DUF4190 domain-containing protein n=1 Tax=Leifsonia poae TaxID=110933 RepID=UPI001CC0664D|nr:DUF4190 domain-containing protein [Leifsonia poae]
MSTPDLPEQPSPSPQYQAPAPQYQPAPARYNTMSIVAFILAFFVSIVGIILGFIGLSQIKKTGEQGRGLAIAAIIIGFVEVVLTIIIVILSIVAIGIAATTTYSTN